MVQSYEEWFEPKNEKQRQIDVLKKIFPAFSEKNWVLWVITDFYYKYSSEIKGNILIEKKDGTFLTIPYLQRTPYKNKRISQLSMKKGRYRFYGFPLIFNSFEEIAEIKKITINWNIYYPLYLNDKAFKIKATNVLITYNLNFEKDALNSDYHFFTLHSYDYLYNDIRNMRKDKDLSITYYENFDTALNIKGFIEFDHETNKYIHNVLETYDIKNAYKSLMLRNKDKKLSLILENYPQNTDLLKGSLKKVKIKKEIDWDAFYYEKNTSLKATYMSDLF